MNDENHKPKRLIRLREVRERIGLQTTQIYDLINEKRFPAPVPIGPRAVAWVESEVDRWIEDRISERAQMKTMPRSGSIRRPRQQLAAASQGERPLISQSGDVRVPRRNRCTPREVDVRNKSPALREHLPHVPKHGQEKLISRLRGDESYPATSFGETPAICQHSDRLSANRHPARLKPVRDP